MKDLQGHSTRTTTKTTNSYSNSNVDDSENMTQPPPQHPLFEHHQHHNHDHHHHNNNNNQQHLNHLEREQEKSISDETMEGDLFDCALEQYSKQQPKRSKKANGNIINYCKNNNPHQSIKKPTDGTGSHKNNIITSYYDHQSHEDMDDNYPKEEVDYDDVDDVDVVKHDYHDDDDHHHHHHYENDSSNSIFDHHEHLQRQQQQQMQQTIKARPNVAASSPIQVPARRARKDFYSMKLNMLKVERDDDIQDESSTGLDAGNASTTDESTSSSTATQDSEDFSPVRRGDRNRPPIENMPAFDEDDAFLDREFNENHYNHYVLDGLDDEHLTAEEDPMRLFASIQALAKSLHEDAELFGSLPPKRLLESPIRSIAFV